eukprot:TRINITY_DN25373_c0_g1_i1.p1 TRINITY_DN25373_c0_g1~~TRINITY_DN25373_c0_g1_i1.p1  ORF type:complete len:549 (-),score=74.83 TRINITY_DN25373_c0_g1_i1:104-1693(-)
MGVNCSAVELPKVSGCLDESRYPHGCGLGDDAHQADDNSLSRPPASGLLAQKGLVIFADSVDGLVRALPFELDADLDHLYALPISDGTGSGIGRTAMLPPEAARDVGVRCESLAEDGDNRDNYAILQVDDLANPWGLYMVADGSGKQGHLISALLVHELPSLLVQNPGLHRNTCLALHQAYLSISEMVTTCQYVDATHSGSTLATVLLRDGLLHVAWVGDSKAVLGRVAARPTPPAGSQPNAVSNPGGAPAGAYSLSHARPRPGAAGRPLPPVPTPAASMDGIHRGPPPLLRAIDMTADSATDATELSRTPSLNGPGATSSRVPTGGTGDADAPEGEWSMDGGGPGRAVPSRGVQARGFGHQALTASGDSGGAAAPQAPEVRRLRLKPEDLFVIMGTTGLWNHLSPAEAVAIVGQNLHRPARSAADALVTEVTKRSVLGGAGAEDLTVFVLYLQGERFVQPDDGTNVNLFDAHQHVLREARDHLVGCGCVPPAPGRPIATAATPLAPTAPAAAALVSASRPARNSQITW